MFRMMSRTRFYTIAIAVGLLSSLLLSACQPVRPESELDNPTTFAAPQRDLGQGDFDPSSICNAVPEQRIVAGLDRVICEVIPGLCDPNSETPLDGMEVLRQYRIEFPLFNGFAREGQDQRVLLVEGPGVEQLNILREYSEVIVNPNHYVYMIEGAHSPGFSPFGGGPAPAINAGLSDFQDQWAIQKITSTPMYTQYLATGGKDVIVGIFDSSPFTLTPFPEQQTLSVTNEPFLTLTNHYTPVLSSGNNPSGIDHGVFVAGLLHQIAPQADIHLYRTFNESGETDGFTLGSQLHQFFLDQIKPLTLTETDTYPKRFVANMSFGLACPPDFEESEEFNEEVRSIARHTDSLLDEGVVVVAAAGNTANRLNIDVAVPDTHFPASYSRVISAGALNSDGRAACFSHDADTFAPGGEGKVDDGSCQPIHYQCADQSNCTTALMSLATESPTGLAYWSGTSFATPLVSGLVALRLGMDNEPPLIDSLTGLGYQVVDVEAIESEFKGSIFSK